MRHDLVDKYSGLNSPIHRASAALKLAVALMTIVLVVITPLERTGWLAAPLLFLVVVAILSHVPPGFLLRRIALLEPFVAAVALLSLLQPNGLAIAGGIVAKSTLCLLAMLLLTNTTSFAHLLGVLKRAGVPSLLVTVLALMYRYIFVLVDEAERMRRARRSRTFTTSHRTLWRSLATLVGQLFVRSTERAERIYAAMCSRGWK